MVPMSVRVPIRGRLNNFIRTSATKAPSATTDKEFLFFRVNFIAPLY